MKKRTLVVRSILEPIGKIKQAISAKFAVMLPAFGNANRSTAEAIIGELVDLGCIEVCCVGTEAEELHDAVDRIIEDKNVLNVVTTWHGDPQEACEYFVNVAGARPPFLLALIADNVELSAMLHRSVFRD